MMALRRRPIVQAWMRGRAASPTLRLERAMVGLLCWLLLLFFCWPLALLALVLYPLAWLLLLPLRVIGIGVDGVLALLAAVVMLPARMLRGGPGR